MGSMFEVISRRQDEGGENFDLSVAGDHFIYKAHFPGEPVTPGVCLIQTGVELLELSTGEALVPVRIKNVKFLRIINPLETPAISVTLRKTVREGNLVSSQISFVSGEETFAKISVICQTEEFA